MTPIFLFYFLSKTAVNEESPTAAFRKKRCRGQWDCRDERNTAPTVRKIATGEKR